MNASHTPSPLAAVPMAPKDPILGVTETYNNDTNSTYQMLWGSGTSVYGTAGIYCNPYADSIYASAYYYTSDERKKKNIRSIESPIALINLLDGKYFDWINTNKSDAGLIAQDVQKAIPEAVSIGGDGFLSVNSAAVIGLLVNAIKDQQKQIDALTAMVEEIRNA